MPRHRPPTAAAGTPDDVEAQFYEALQRADLEALMSVWADEEEIVCVHPGGPRLVGLAAIRGSFEGIFGNGAIAVQIEQVHRLSWLGGTLHHLVERIEVPAEGGGRQTAWVFATNVYVKTTQGWRLVAHHASPGSLQEPPEAGDGPATLH